MFQNANIISKSQTPETIHRFLSQSVPITSARKPQPQHESDRELDDREGQGSQGKSQTPPEES